MFHYSLLLLIAIAGICHGAGVGGSTSGYLYQIQPDNSITKAELLSTGLGPNTTIVSKNNGGFSKTNLAVGPDALHWFAYSSQVYDWSLLCIYSFNVVSGNQSNIVPLTCGNLVPDGGWPYNLYYSDEYDGLYWLTSSGFGWQIHSTARYLSGSQSINFIDNEPFWGPPGFAVTKDAKGNGVVVENTDGMVNNGPQSPALYTWNYQPNSTANYYSPLPVKDPSAPVYYSHSGKVDIVFAKNNPVGSATELYFVTAFQPDSSTLSGYTFQVSKMELVAPASGQPASNKTTLLLDWTIGNPYSLSVDPVNQMMYLYYIVYNVPYGAPNAFLSRVDISGALPSTNQVLWNSSESNFPYSNMIIRAKSTPNGSKPSINSYSPSSGPQSGGTLVTILGGPFAETAPSLSCRFGGVVVVKATALSDSAAYCTSPASPVKGPSTLQISNDGVNYSTSVTFTYV